MRAATLTRWIDALHAHWGDDADALETGRQVEIVLRFCSLAQDEPDALVASLFRPTEEGPRIRVKRRREVIALIERFEREAGGGDVGRGRADGNVVRSFLIHNGIALSAPALY